ncbi:ankyrin repeat domain-containing protein [Roseicella aquatilis]|uniref:Uncharacterized protein n=1 Tax=Roseicella aquatilis TaxID=2527868 RepID=A0A4R4DX24_9PROT|nr:ankyrin repeat domain-containing protein [Roseicella aquatilis]TCZ66081.1 hypothetical protein EXY23_03095 [Roseicella aquatilis]
MAHIDRDDLLAALLAGNLARLRRLLAGAEVEDPDLPHQITPMMAAAACGHEAAVEMLLQGGADPARRDAAGRTAAAYARDGGHPHLAARLDTVVDQERRMW